MEERRPRERELVLAPNEYAFVLDTTKGHINCYVGPNKTSLAQTDQPVIYATHSGQFEYVELGRAVCLFPTARRNEYIELENPAADSAPPNPGVSNTLVPLRTGEKINLPGPTAFPLWPGQIARVIPGHRLRSNQYLYVRIYDVDAASRSWNEAVGASPDAPVPTFVTGEQRILRGTDLSFFVPPTGVEVVADDRGNFVRVAVTLQRLEYVVLIGEDGRKRYLRGESVIFPEPDEVFVMRKTAGGHSPKHRAIELSETTGVHVKVVAPYEDAEGAHVEGEELFITGANRIYFPREEHVIVRYGRHQLHQAVAVPRGDGRYLLNRQSGEVELVAGPRMLLPDPRTHVMTRRVLSDRECHLLFPGNEDALSFNRRLRHGEVGRRTRKPKGQRNPTPDNETRGAGDGIERAVDFVEPRTITLDTRFAGVVRVDVWPGYAVQVVDRSGARRVEAGPTSVTLAFDETLAALSLSTSTPKCDAVLLETGYLKVTGNKVSDVVHVSSSDMVDLTLHVVYRVDFDGADPNRWFAVDNYVKLLCDHAGSILKSAVRKVSVLELQSTVTETVRDALLGTQTDGEPRAGLFFSENGMRVHDVEVLHLAVVDEAVDQLLTESQTAAIERAVDLSSARAELQNQSRLAEMQRVSAAAVHETRMGTLMLQAMLAEREAELELQSVAASATLQSLADDKALKSAEAQTQLAREQHLARRERHELNHVIQTEEQTLRLKDLEARVAAASAHAQAWSPQLIEAIRRLGDEQLLAALSENFAELAAVEGRGLLETARKFMDFVPNGFMPVLRDGE